ncbi:MAG: hypothetical protein FJ025_01100 [Chloroflexi bacterium]|nr:hypothetical protein [Chloroflexota bacterium]
MKKRWAFAIPIVLLLAIIGGLTAGCEWLSSLSTTSTPSTPASEYPADIIGRVTIAKKVMSGGNEVRPYGNHPVWWIVEVSVKNKEYQHPVTSVRDKSIPLPEGVAHHEIWSIIFNGKIWATPILDSPPTTVSQGQSGNMIFVFEMGGDEAMSDTQICYRGQEPFSYGKLITGDTVAVYDWDLQKVAQVSEAPPKTNIATVEGMWESYFHLVVQLKPTSEAIANKAYVVDLYEKGHLRDTTTVSWNQPEINVLLEKTVSFPLTEEEGNAYFMQDVSHIFSVKVHE